MKIVFHTKTILDLKMLTVLGVTVKDKENAIGKYGTGIKYGLSVLSRLEIGTELHINGTVHTLNCREDDFRDKAFSVVYLNDMQLPFCTNYGLNWSLEDAYREFASNTLDEDGEILILQDGEEFQSVENYTSIVIDSDEMVKIHQDGDILLNMDDYTVVHSNSYVDLLLPKDPEARITKNIYFQGIKASEFKEKNSLFVYNFKMGVSLSEDRKISSQWNVEYYIKYTILYHISDMQLLEKILTQHNHDCIEHTWNYNDISEPSISFLDVAFKLRSERKLADCFVKVIESSSSSGVLTRASAPMWGYLLLRMTRYIEFVRSDLLGELTVKPFKVRSSDSSSLKRLGYMINRENETATILFHNSLVENFNDETRGVIVSALLDYTGNKDLFLQRFIADNKDDEQTFIEEAHWENYCSSVPLTVQVESKDEEEKEEEDLSYD